VASDKLDDAAAALIDKISAAMSAADLVALNTESVETEAPAQTIAAAWLASHAGDLE
jgi:osmoprotectant transport system substrate-binding protein